MAPCPHDVMLAATKEKVEDEGDMEDDLAELGEP